MELKELSISELEGEAYALHEVRAKARRTLGLLEAEIQHRRDVRSAALTEHAKEHVDVLLLLIPDHNGLCSDAKPRTRTHGCDRCWLLSAKKDGYVDLNITGLSFSFE